MVCVVKDVSTRRRRYPCPSTVLRSEKRVFALNRVATALGVAAAALLVLAAARPATAVVAVSCPAMAPRSGGTFVSEITIDAGANALGAYTLDITYDPAVVTIASIAGGTTAEFAVPPITNPARFASGRVRLVAFNSASFTAPAGLVSVARITFNAVGLPGASTSLGLEIITLANTDGVKIAAGVSGCAVAIATTLPTATPTYSPTHAPTATPASTAGRCTGDCNGDGEVRINELLSGVDIALATLSVDTCSVFDRSGDGQVTIDELMVAVGALLRGCPRPAVTATPTPVQTFSATSTPTPTRTPATRTVAAPEIPRRGVYHSYPGYEIGLPIAASDPQGTALHYAPRMLPQGAHLDASTGLFSWIPGADQIGPFYVPFTVTNETVPQASAQGTLALQISPPDSCVVPACDPATGCQRMPRPLSEQCCTAEPQIRVAQAIAECPEGGVIFVGRNTTGFGRLQSCDQLRVINFLQEGASVRFHVETRCVDPAHAVTLHARLETSSRVLFDQDQVIILRLRSDGYAEKLALVFPVEGPGPFSEFEGAEAQLSVEVAATGGMRIQSQLRLRLTLNALDDLLDAQDVAPAQVGVGVKGGP